MIVYEISTSLHVLIVIKGGSDRNTLLDYCLSAQKLTMRLSRSASNGILNYRSIDDGFSENWLKTAPSSVQIEEPVPKMSSTSKSGATTVSKRRSTGSFPRPASSRGLFPDILSSRQGSRREERSTGVSRRFYRSEFAPIYQLKVTWH